MARIRYLKPDFFKDEDLAEHPYWIRLLYAGLWGIADKAGRLKDRHKWIKAELFPYDNDIDIEKGLKALAQNKKISNRPFIIRYQVNNESFIQILKWEEHQRPHHTEKESEIPPYPPKYRNGEENGDGNGECASPKVVVKERLNNGEITVKTIQTNPEIKLFIDWFFQEFKTRFGEKYLVTGKDASIVKRLLGTFDLENLKNITLKFFDCEDDFIKRAGYTIGILSVTLNKVTSARQNEPKGYSGLREYMKEREGRKQIEG